MILGDIKKAFDVLFHWIRQGGILDWFLLTQLANILRLSLASGNLTEAPAANLRPTTSSQLRRELPFKDIAWGCSLLRDAIKGKGRFSSNFLETKPPEDFLLVSLPVLAANGHLEFALTELFRQHENERSSYADNIARANKLLNENLLMRISTSLAIQKKWMDLLSLRER
jgi:hypothetical protein